MSKKWTRIKNTLFLSEGHNFERAVMPFLRVVWSNAIKPQSLGTADKKGIDILVLDLNDESVDFSIAIQCKGFQQDEKKIGDDQYRQCKKSIEVFRESPFKVQKYILLVNRYLDNKEFRDKVQNELNTLITSGTAQEAILWSFQDLLKEAGEKVREKCYEFIQLNSNKIQDFLVDNRLCHPLEEVPIEVYEMVITPNRKESEKFLEKKICDASKELIEIAKNTNITLVLAKAGYGKTTSALRTFEITKKRIFYLSAASLSRDSNKSSALIKEWVKLDEFWENISDEDFLVADALFSDEIKYILRDSNTDMILILDGLDESVYFSRDYGIQDLFNHIRDIKVPVILLAREEFWEKKQTFFSETIGAEARSKDRIVKNRINILKLIDWEETQIKKFAERYKETLEGNEKTNLNELIELIESNEFNKIYGDIPKRPLFLNYILESVAFEGIKKKGKAELFYKWVEAKIIRDIRNPTRFGGKGRKSIIQNQHLNKDEIVRLSFKIMKIAASKMILIDRKKNLELIPSCDIEELKKEDVKLNLYLDSISLFLHSLLEEDKSTPEKQTIKFSHRTYQEFFLALYIRDNSSYFESMKLPEAIKTHLEEIQEEGL